MKRFSPAAVLIVLCAAGVGTPVSAAQARQCAPQGQYRIDITAGDIACDDAYTVAQGYNLVGEKYQDIREFTCYTGDSQTQPLIFQCVSSTTEFGVYWA